MVAAVNLKDGQRPELSRIPTDPGVYRFREADGRIIYVGKARNLRSRISSYFSDSTQHMRTRSMVASAASLDWTVVGTEVEALQLEYAWIKEFDPRFNVRYRDDKSYPYLAITMSEEFPRAMVMRGRRRRGTRYFGPYSHAWAIRDALDQILRALPMRSCSSGVFRRAHVSGRPCLLADIGKCSAPCVGRIDAESHRRLAVDVARLLSGGGDVMVAERRAAMADAASHEEYERAARLRDQIAALERVLERNSVVLGPDVDADVVGLHLDELEAAVQVFFVRSGRVVGRRGWITERVEELDAAGLLEMFLGQLYSDVDPDEVPREILLAELPADADAVQAWLSARRGGPVRLRVPRRGSMRDLLTTVERNAEEAFGQHRLKRAGDLSARSAALQELQDALDLPLPPLRIECIDVSHLSGTQAVASVVVFEDGAPRPRDYRHLIIDAAHAGDDTASVAEVVSRRFRATAPPESAEPATQEPDSGPPRRRPRAFAYPPHLLVIDGGPAQAAAARAAAAASGGDAASVPIIGLAKRLEEVWPAGAADPVVLPRGSEGLYLLQRVRDEAHRFAIAFHRKRRGRAMTESALDAIPGLGPARRAALIDAFGSVAAMRAASPEELARVPGIGPRLADTIATALRSAESAGPAVNTSTGEIVQ